MKRLRCTLHINVHERERGRGRKDLSDKTMIIHDGM